MACPTCDHTLQLLFHDRERKIYHCPRCGTIRSELFGHIDDTVPKVIGYLRSFHRMIDNTGAGRALRELAKIEGITESILKPEDRPPDST